MTDSATAQYEAIYALKDSSLIRIKLKEYDEAFRTAYRKYKVSLKNKKYIAIVGKDIHASKVRANYRKRVEANPSTFVKKAIDFSNVDATAERAYKVSVKPNAEVKPSDCTIKNKLTILTRIYEYKYKRPLPENHHFVKYINGEPYKTEQIFKDFGWIIEDVVNVAEYLNQNIKTLYGCFANFNIGRLSGVRKALYPYMLKVNEVYRKTRNEPVNDKLKDVYVSFKKEDVLENAQKIECDRLKLMYLLMMLLPPRRIGELSFLRIAKDATDIDNEGFNWYYQGSLYNNKTKTGLSYKNEDIPAEIIEMIDRLPTDTDFIFKTANISNMFSKLLFKIYKIKLCCNDLRHLYASESCKTTDAVQMEKDAYLMNHTVAEHCCKYIIKRD